MQKITPCLWFDGNAEEAMNFYVSVFNNSKTGSIARYDKAAAQASGQPEGSVLTVTFELEGYHFMGLNGGPMYKFTPAISFFVSCDTESEIDHLYNELSKDGQVLMPYQEYPFSKKYAWITDQFGVSWQLSLAESSQKITPAFLFTGEQFGRVEEAIKLYTSLFPNSGIETISRYEAGEGPEGAIKYSRFKLDGEEFVAMESDLEHKFGFTEAVSLSVNCNTQAEVDHYWDKLSEGGEEGPCGWLKDPFGVSWQIVPEVMGRLMSDPSPAKSQNVMKTMLQMKKLDISELQAAYDQA